MPALPARYYALIFALVMSFFMSLLMSGVITLINTGIHGDFSLRWGRAFMVAWIVAFPLVSLIAPLAHKITRKIAKSAP